MRFDGRVLYCLQLVFTSRKSLLFQAYYCNSVSPYCISTTATAVPTLLHVSLFWKSYHSSGALPEVSFHFIHVLFLFFSYISPPPPPQKSREWIDNVVCCTDREILRGLAYKYKTD